MKKLQWAAHRQMVIWLYFTILCTSYVNCVEDSGTDRKNDPLIISIDTDSTVNGEQEFDDFSTDEKNTEHKVISKRSPLFGDANTSVKTRKKITIVKKKKKVCCITTNKVKKCSEELCKISSAPNIKVKEVVGKEVEDFEKNAICYYAVQGEYPKNVVSAEWYKYDKSPYWTMSDIALEHICKAIIFYRPGIITVAQEKFAICHFAEHGSYPVRYKDTSYWSSFDFSKLWHYDDNYLKIFCNIEIITRPVVQGLFKSSEFYLFQKYLSEKYLKAKKNENLVHACCLNDAEDEREDTDGSFDFLHSNLKYGNPKSKKIEVNIFYNNIDDGGNMKWQGIKGSRTRVSEEQTEEIEESKIIAKQVTMEYKNLLLYTTLKIEADVICYFRRNGKYPKMYLPISDDLNNSRLWLKSTKELDKMCAGKQIHRPTSGGEEHEELDFIIANEIELQSVCHFAKNGKYITRDNNPTPEIVRSKFWLRSDPWLKLTCGYKRDHPYRPVEFWFGEEMEFSYGEKPDLPRNLLMNSKKINKYWVVNELDWEELEYYIYFGGYLKQNNVPKRASRVLFYTEFSNFELFLLKLNSKGFSEEENDHPCCVKRICAKEVPRRRVQKDIGEWSSHSENKINIFQTNIYENQLRKKIKTPKQIRTTEDQEEIEITETEEYEINRIKKQKLLEDINNKKRVLKKPINTGNEQNLRKHKKKKESDTIEDENDLNEINIKRKTIKVHKTDVENNIHEIENNSRNVLQSTKNLKKSNTAKKSGANLNAGKNLRKDTLIAINEIDDDSDNVRVKVTKIKKTVKADTEPEANIMEEGDNEEDELGKKRVLIRKVKVGNLSTPKPIINQRPKNIRKTSVPTAGQLIENTNINNAHNVFRINKPLISSSQEENSSSKFVIEAESRRPLVPELGSVYSYKPISNIISDQKQYTPGSSASVKISEQPSKNLTKEKPGALVEVVPLSEPQKTAKAKIESPLIKASIFEPVISTSDNIEANLQNSNILSSQKSAIDTRPVSSSLNLKQSDHTRENSTLNSTKEESSPENRPIESNIISSPLLLPIPNQHDIKNEPSGLIKNKFPSEGHLPGNSILENFVHKKQDFNINKKLMEQTVKMEVPLQTQIPETKKLDLVGEKSESTFKAKPARLPLPTKSTTEDTAPSTKDEKSKPVSPIIPKEHITSSHDDSLISNSKVPLVPDLKVVPLSNDAKKEKLSVLGGQQSVQILGDKSQPIKLLENINKPHDLLLIPGININQPANKNIAISVSEDLTDGPTDSKSSRKKILIQKNKPIDLVITPQNNVAASPELKLPKPKIVLAEVAKAAPIFSPEDTVVSNSKIPLVPELSSTSVTLNKTNDDHKQKLSVLGGQQSVQLPTDAPHPINKPIFSIKPNAKDEIKVLEKVTHLHDLAFNDGLNLKQKSDKNIEVSVSGHSKIGPTDPKRSRTKILIQKDKPSHLEIAPQKNILVPTESKLSNPKIVSGEFAKEAPNVPTEYDVVSNSKVPVVPELTSTSIPPNLPNDNDKKKLSVLGGQQSVQIPGDKSLPLNIPIDSIKPDSGDHSKLKKETELHDLELNSGSSKIGPTDLKSSRTKIVIQKHKTSHSEIAHEKNILASPESKFFENPKIVSAGFPKEAPIVTPKDNLVSNSKVPLVPELTSAFVPSNVPNDHKQKLSVLGGDQSVQIPGDISRPIIKPIAPDAGDHNKLMEKLTKPHDLVLNRNIKQTSDKNVKVSVSGHSKIGSTDSKRSRTKFAIQNDKPSHLVIAPQKNILASHESKLSNPKIVSAGFPKEAPIVTPKDAVVSTSKTPLVPDLTSASAPTNVPNDDHEQKVSVLGGQQLAQMPEDISHPIIKPLAPDAGDHNRLMEKVTKPHESVLNTNIKQTYDKNIKVSVSGHSKIGPTDSKRSRTKILIQKDKPRHLEIAPQKNILTSPESKLSNPKIVSAGFPNEAPIITPKEDVVSNSKVPLVPELTSEFVPPNLPNDDHKQKISLLGGKQSVQIPGDKSHPLNIPMVSIKPDSRNHNKLKKETELHDSELNSGSNINQPSNKNIRISVSGQSKIGPTDLKSSRTKIVIQKHKTSHSVIAHEKNILSSPESKLSNAKIVSAGFPKGAPIVTPKDDVVSNSKGLLLPELTSAFVPPNVPNNDHKQKLSVLGGGKSVQIPGDILRPIIKPVVPDVGNHNKLMEPVTNPHDLVLNANIKQTSDKNIKVSDSGHSKIGPTDSKHSRSKILIQKDKSRHLEIAPSPESDVPKPKLVSGGVPKDAPIVSPAYNVISSSKFPLVPELPSTSVPQNAPNDDHKQKLSALVGTKILIQKDKPSHLKIGPKKNILASQSDLPKRKLLPAEVPNKAPIVSREDNVISSSKFPLVPELPSTSVPPNVPNDDHKQKLSGLGGTKKLIQKNKPRNLEIAPEKNIKTSPESDVPKLKLLSAEVPKEAPIVLPEDNVISSSKFPLVPELPSTSVPPNVPSDHKQKLSILGGDQSVQIPGDILRPIIKPITPDAGDHNKRMENLTKPHDLVLNSNVKQTSDKNVKVSVSGHSKIGPTDSKRSRTKIVIQKDKSSYLVIPPQTNILASPKSKLSNPKIVHAGLPKEASIIALKDDVISTSKLPLVAELTSAFVPSSVPNDHKQKLSVLGGDQSVQIPGDILHPVIKPIAPDAGDHNKLMEKVTKPHGLVLNPNIKETSDKNIKVSVSGHSKIGPTDSKRSRTKILIQKNKPSHLEIATQKNILPSPKSDVPKPKIVSVGPPEDNVISNSKVPELPAPTVPLNFPNDDQKRKLSIIGGQQSVQIPGDISKPISIPIVSKNPDTADYEKLSEKAKISHELGLNSVSNLKQPSNKNLKVSVSGHSKIGPTDSKRSRTKILIQKNKPSNLVIVPQKNIVASLGSNLLPNENNQNIPDSNSGIKIEDAVPVPSLPIEGVPIENEKTEGEKSKLSPQPELSLIDVSKINSKPNISAHGDHKETDLNIPIAEQNLPIQKQDSLIQELVSNYSTKEISEEKERPILTTESIDKEDIEISSVESSLPGSINPNNTQKNDTNLTMPLNMADKSVPVSGNLEAKQQDSFVEELVSSFSTKHVKSDTPVQYGLSLPDRVKETKPEVDELAPTDDTLIASKIINTTKDLDTKERESIVTELVSSYSTKYVKTDFSIEDVLLPSTITTQVSSNVPQIPIQSQEVLETKQQDEFMKELVSTYSDKEKIETISNTLLLPEVPNDVKDNSDINLPKFGGQQGVNLPKTVTSIPNIFPHDTQHNKEIRKTLGHPKTVDIKKPKKNIIISVKKNGPENVHIKVTKTREKTKSNKSETEHSARDIESKKGPLNKNLEPITKKLSISISKATDAGPVSTKTKSKVVIQNQKNKNKPHEPTFLSAQPLLPMQNLKENSKKNWEDITHITDQNKINPYPDKVKLSTENEKQRSPSIENLETHKQESFVKHLVTSYSMKKIGPSAEEVNKSLSSYSTKDIKTDASSRPIETDILTQNNSQIVDTPSIDALNVPAPVLPVSEIPTSNIENLVVDVQDSVVKELVTSYSSKNFDTSNFSEEVIPSTTQINSGILPNKTSSPSNIENLEAKQQDSFIQELVSSYSTKHIRSNVSMGEGVSLPDQNATSDRPSSISNNSKLENLEAAQQNNTKKIETFLTTDNTLPPTTITNATDAMLLQQSMNTEVLEAKERDAIVNDLVSSYSSKYVKTNSSLEEANFPISSNSQSNSDSSTLSIANQDVVEAMSQDVFIKELVSSYSDKENIETISNTPLLPEVPKVPSNPNHEDNLSILNSQQAVNLPETVQGLELPNSVSSTSNPTTIPSYIQPVKENEKSLQHPKVVAVKKPKKNIIISVKKNGPENVRVKVTKTKKKPKLKKNEGQQNGKDVEKENVSFNENLSQLETNQHFKPSTKKLSVSISKTTNEGPVLTKTKTKVVIQSKKPKSQNYGIKQHEPIFLNGVPLHKVTENQENDKQEVNTNNLLTSGSTKQVKTNSAAEDLSLLKLSNNNENQLNPSVDHSEAQKQDSFVKELVTSYSTKKVKSSLVDILPADTSLIATIETPPVEELSDSKSTNLEAKEQDIFMNKLVSSYNTKDIKTNSTDKGTVSPSEMNLLTSNNTQTADTNAINRQTTAQISPASNVENIEVQSQDSVVKELVTSYSTKEVATNNLPGLGTSPIKPSANIEDLEAKQQDYFVQELVSTYSTKHVTSKTPLVEDSSLPNQDKELRTEKPSLISSQSKLENSEVAQQELFLKNNTETIQKITNTTDGIPSDFNTTNAENLEGKEREAVVKDLVSSYSSKDIKTNSSIEETIFPNTLPSPEVINTDAIPLKPNSTNAEILEANERDKIIKDLVSSQSSKYVKNNSSMEEVLLPISSNPQNNLDSSNHIITNQDVVEAKQQDSLIKELVSSYSDKENIETISNTLLLPEVPNVPSNPSHEENLAILNSQQTVNLPEAVQGLELPNSVSSTSNPTTIPSYIQSVKENEKSLQHPKIVEVKKPKKNIIISVKKNGPENVRVKVTKTKKKPKSKKNEGQQNRKDVEKENVSFNENLSQLETNQHFKPSTKKLSVSISKTTNEGPVLTKTKTKVVIQSKKPKSQNYGIKQHEPIILSGVPLHKVIGNQENDKQEVNKNNLLTSGSTQQVKINSAAEDLSLLKLTTNNENQLNPSVEHLEAQKQDLFVKELVTSYSTKKVKPSLIEIFPAAPPLKATIETPPVGELSDSKSANLEAKEQDSFMKELVSTYNTKDIKTNSTDKGTASSPEMDLISANNTQTADTNAINRQTTGQILPILGAPTSNVENIEVQSQDSVVKELVTSYSTKEMATNTLPGAGTTPIKSSNIEDLEAKQQDYLVQELVSTYSTKHVTPKTPVVEDSSLPAQDKELRTEKPSPISSQSQIENSEVAQQDQFLKDSTASIPKIINTTDVIPSDLNTTNAENLEAKEREALVKDLVSSYTSKDIKTNSSIEETLFPKTLPPPEVTNADATSLKPNSTNAEILEVNERDKIIKDLVSSQSSKYVKNNSPIEEVLFPISSNPQNNSDLLTLSIANQDVVEAKQQDVFIKELVSSYSDKENIETISNTPLLPEVPNVPSSPNHEDNLTILNSQQAVNLPETVQGLELPNSVSSTSNPTTIPSYIQPVKENEKSVQHPKVVEVKKPKKNIIISVKKNGPENVRVKVTKTKKKNLSQLEANQHVKPSTKKLSVIESQENDKQNVNTNNLLAYGSTKQVKTNSAAEDFSLVKLTNNNENQLNPSVEHLEAQKQDLFVKELVTSYSTKKVKPSLVEILPSAPPLNPTKETLPVEGLSDSKSTNLEAKEQDSFMNELVSTYNTKDIKTNTTDKMTVPHPEMDLITANNTQTADTNAISRQTTGQILHGLGVPTLNVENIQVQSQDSIVKELVTSFSTKEVANNTLPGVGTSPIKPSNIEDFEAKQQDYFVQELVSTYSTKHITPKTPVVENSSVAGQDKELRTQKPSSISSQSKIENSEISQQNQFLEDNTLTMQKTTNTTDFKPSDVNSTNAENIETKEREKLVKELVSSYNSKDIKTNSSIEEALFPKTLTSPEVTNTADAIPLKPNSTNAEVLEANESDKMIKNLVSSYSSKYIKTNSSMEEVLLPISSKTQSSSDLPNTIGKEEAKQQDKLVKELVSSYSDKENLHTISDSALVPELTNNIKNENSEHKLSILGNQEPINLPVINAIQGLESPISKTDSEGATKEESFSKAVVSNHSSKYNQENGNKTAYIEPLTEDLDKEPVQHISILSGEQTVNLPSAAPPTPLDLKLEKVFSKEDATKKKENLENKEKDEIVKELVKSYSNKNNYTEEEVLLPLPLPVAPSTKPTGENALPPFTETKYIKPNSIPITDTTSIKHSENFRDNPATFLDNELQSTQHNQNSKEKDIRNISILGGQNSINFPNTGSELPVASNFENQIESPIDNQKNIQNFNGESIRKPELTKQPLSVVDLISPRPLENNRKINSNQINSVSHREPTIINHELSEKPESSVPDTIYKSRPNFKQFSDIDYKELVESIGKSCNCDLDLLETKLKRYTEELVQNELRKFSYDIMDYVKKEIDNKFEDCRNSKKSVPCEQDNPFFY